MEKSIFYETVPWCQKGWGPLIYSHGRMIKMRPKNGTSFISRQLYVQKEKKKKNSSLLDCCSWFCLVAKSYLTLCDPKDCSPPGSSVHRISQARILEWVAISFSRGSSHPRDWAQVSCIGRWILYHWATREDIITRGYLFKHWPVFAKNSMKVFGKICPNYWESNSKYTSFWLVPKGKCSVRQ